MNQKHKDEYVAFLSVIFEFNILGKNTADCNLKKKKKKKKKKFSYFSQKRGFNILCKLFA